MAGLFRAIAADIDGTLTLRRGDVRLSVNAIKGIREAERAGVRVILVSGNSLPVTLGLRTYLGASGPAVAENGCLVFHEGQVIHVCEGRVPQELVDEAKSLGLVESWQNPYRVHDVAFHVPRGLRSLDRVIAELRESASRRGMSVLWSGYAVHINAGRGKAVGVAKAIELLGLGPEEVAAIGDGENDLDMLRLAAFSGCPSDAADVVRASVKFVATRPGGSGFLEFVREVLRRNREFV